MTDNGNCFFFFANGEMIQYESDVVELMVLAVVSVIELVRSAFYITMPHCPCKLIIKEMWFRMSTDGL